MTLSNFFSYLREAFARKGLSMWGLITGVAGLLAYIGMDKADTSVRCLTLALIVVLSLAIWSIWQGYNFFLETIRPLKVLMIVPGTHYYKGYLMLLIERRHWLFEGQLLVLNVSKEQIREPVGLVKIETLNPAGLPQAILVRYFDEDQQGKPQDYLLDRPRWPALEAACLIPFDKLA